MKLYAETPARRTRQLLGDALLVGWIALWALIARQAHRLVMSLDAPGRGMERAGGTIQGGLTGAGDQAARVPVVGRALRDALADAAGAGTALADAGRAQQETIARLAWWAAALLIVLPALVALALWAPPRLRGIAAMTSAAVARGRPGSTRLLALRALTHQPMARLDRLAAELGTRTDLVLAWREADPVALDRLADLELTRIGLRPVSGSRRRAAV